MKGRPGGWESELLVAYLLPFGNVAAYSVPLVRVLFVLADIDSELAHHEQRKRVAGAFVISELAPGGGVDPVKPLRDVDQRFANLDAMEPAGVERLEDRSNQARGGRRHHPKGIDEVGADGVQLGVDDRLAEELAGLRLV
ncbi:hypothetical protein [Corallococcus exiguus]|uniref:hypothetical protein n=1 Tax=Corallococcus exiguus TaxID=83462 RepID=UPI0014949E7E|nr:hypothetical protein [Corallococcus exiguus]